MTSFILRIDHQNAAHVRVSVFAGVDPEHRAHAGQLTFRAGAEWEAFRALFESAMSKPTEGGSSDADR